MTEDLRVRADNNLSTAVERMRLTDPRPAYRERLRVLKEQRPDAFSEALRHYEADVVPALAEGKDPVSAWVEYGGRIGSLTAPGRLVAIDGSGRAIRYKPPAQPDALILHLPDDNAAPVLVAVAPAEPTAAQQAAMDLLVNRRLSL